MMHIYVDRVIAHRKNNRGKCGWHTIKIMRMLLNWFSVLLISSKESNEETLISFFSQVFLVNI